MSHPIPEAPPAGDGAMRRPTLHGSWPEMTYAGVLSFLRRTYTRDLTGAAVVDAGDCWLDPHNPLTIPGAIRDHARRILASGAR
ncbi:MAG: hypothetical protein RQ830_04960, partial [Tepidimonas sp.]|nr:hypothetical protein [Tepidimonas sp.]